MLQYSYIFDRLFSLGINQHDSSDNIPEGYVEDAINVDVEASSLVLRQGFEKFAGDVPLRVEEMRITNSGSNDSGVFILPSYVDLSATTPGPVRLAGSWLDGSGVAHAWDKWYPLYVVGDIYTFLDHNTSATLTTDDTELTQVYQLIGFQEIASAETFLPNDYELTEATLSMAVSYNISADLPANVFTYLPEPDALGNATYYMAGAAGVSAAASISIAGSTHNLSSNLIPLVYEVASAGVFRTITPDTFSIDVSSSDVTMTFSGTTGNIRTLLVEAPSDNYILGTVDGGDSYTIVQIPSPETKFLHAACYVETNTDGDLLQILPDYVRYVAATSTAAAYHEIKFTHGTGSDMNYFITYVYGNTTTNKMVIDDVGAMVSGDIDTAECCMAVYGVNQTQLPVQTHLNFIDNYLANDETVIAADGLLYRSNTDDATSESFDCRARLAASTVIGPVFQNVFPTGPRARTGGFLVSSDISGTGTAEVSAYWYDATTHAGATAVYRLAISSRGCWLVGAAPSYAPSIVTLAYILNLTDATQYLTVSQIPDAKFNGSFEIIAVDETDPDYVDIYVDNSEVNKGIWDTLEAGGKAGIFTDALPFNATPPYFVGQVGDTLAVTDTLTVDIVGLHQHTSITVAAYIDGVTSITRLNAGLRLGASSVTDTLPFTTDDNLVPGDSVVINGAGNRIEFIDDSAGYMELRDPVVITEGQLTIDTPARWEVILPADNSFGSDVVSRTDILKSIPSKGSLYLAEGTKYDGLKTYRTGLPDIQTQLFIQLEDGTGVTPVTPIIAPSRIGSDWTFTVGAATVGLGDTYSQTVGAVTTYYTVAAAATGSTSAVLYGYGPPDTSNLTRVAGAGTDPLVPSAVVPSASLYIDVENPGSFVVGDQILIRQEISTVPYVDPTKLYTVDDIDTNKRLKLSSSFTAHATGIDYAAHFVQYEYFLRLELLDSNGNLVVSASAGSKDLVVRLTKPSKVHIKGFVISPDIENVDYSALNIAVYRRNRTAYNAAAASGSGAFIPFAKVGVLPLSAYSSSTYVDFIDAIADVALTDQDADPIVDPVGEIGETRSGPLKAASVTTMNNQTIYSNLTGDKSLSLGIHGATTEPQLLAQPTWTIAYSGGTQAFTVAPVAAADTVTEIATNYVFTITAGGAAAIGDTYTNNGITFTVTATLAGGTSLYAYGKGAPAASGNLARASGSGTNPIAFSAVATPATSTMVFTLAGDETSTTGSWIYVYNCNPTKLANGTAWLGWWKVVSATYHLTNHTDIVVTNYSAPTSIAALDTASVAAGDLKILHIAGTAVPLADTIASYNLGQVATIGDTVQRMFPFHFASAITAALRDKGIYARAGGDFVLGFMKVHGDLLTSLTVPATTLPAGMVIFGNGVNMTASGSGTAGIVTARRVSYPSRVIMSMPQYPEVFQDVEASSSKTFPTMININPDDGEPVTMCIPFLGSATFGAAQYSNVLVCFKPHSIYIVDVQALYSGNPSYFQRLSTRGLGCEAPSSVCNSKDGLFFANSSGIYMLDTQFQVQYVGHKMERLWESTLVDQNSLDHMCACNYVVDRRYRLSVPTITGTDHQTDTVFSFKYGEDNQNQYAGAWTRYNNIYATGYATRSNRYFFATDQGYVGEWLRTAGSTDHHDAGEAITMEVTFRAMDFSLPTVRKMIKFFTFFLESREDSAAGDIEVYAATDLSKNFVLLDSYNLHGSEAASITDIGDQYHNKVDRVAFSPQIARATWIQVKLVALRLRAGLQVNKLVYRIAAQRTRGEAEAKQTTT